MLYSDVSTNILAQSAVLKKANGFGRNRQTAIAVVADVASGQGRSCAGLKKYSRCSSVDHGAAIKMHTSTCDGCQFVCIWMCAHISLFKAHSRHGKGPPWTTMAAPPEPKLSTMMRWHATKPFFIMRADVASVHARGRRRVRPTRAPEWARQHRAPPSSMTTRSGIVTSPMTRTSTSTIRSAPSSQ